MSISLDFLFAFTSLWARSSEKWNFGNRTRKYPCCHPAVCIWALKGNISLCWLLKGKDMASVEKKIILSHVMNAMNVFLTMKRDMNNISQTGIYIVAGIIFACLHLYST